MTVFERIDTQRSRIVRRAEPFSKRPKSCLRSSRQLNDVFFNVSLRWQLILLLVLTGCSFREGKPCYRSRALKPFSPGGQVETPDRWWMAFNDPGLNLQIDYALSDSFPLAAALNRLQAARALARREASDLLPDLDGIMNTTTFLGRGPDRTSIAWGLDASYQVDLWGQIQSRVDAERFRASATQADYHAVALTLAAEITRVWFSLIEAHAQLELLDEQIKTNRDGLTLQKWRFEIGIVRSPDVLRQEQLVESTLEQAVVVRARIEVLEHLMAVLQGRLPQTASFQPGAELPDLPPLPSTGLPSELLNRRPDVRRDYLAFAAADRDLAAAVSAQYPRLSLTGSLVNGAETPDTLFRDWFLTIGSQLIGPIIDGGQRRAEVDRTSAVAVQRFNEYGQTMLNAFREVEDSLAQERLQIERIEKLEAQVRLAQQASLQLREQYLIGDATYLDVLSAIQSQQRLQRDALSARLELILIRISLYLALAGDFDTRPQAITELPLDLPVMPSDVPELPQDLEELPTPVELAPEISIDE